MAKSPSPLEHHMLSQKLVQEMLVMRDALVQLSLCLKDWQFELDRAGRAAAERETEATLAPMRLKPPPHENMMHIKGKGDSSPE